MFILLWWLKWMVIKWMVMVFMLFVCGGMLIMFFNILFV